MAIGFHTGVLQDKTLDIARVHYQVMTDLLTHGLQKQEQREQEFVQMMSTDFINGLNTKAQEVQLEALRKFNDLGTSIYKERGKFGQIKLDDQIKIKKEKDRLQALQDNMRTTLQTFDQARATLAKDAGRNFDITETTSVINQAAEEWDGESIIGLDRLLVPAFANLPDLIYGHVKNTPKTFDNRQTVTRLTKDPKTGEDIQVTTTEGEVIRMGIDSREKVINHMGTTLVEEGDFKRSAEYVITKLQRRINEGSDNGQMDGDARSAKQSLDAIVGLGSQYAEEGDIPLENGILLAAGMSSLGGIDIEQLWEMQKKSRKETPDKGEKAAGGKQKLMEWQQELTKPLKENGEVVTTGGRPMKGRISIAGFKIKGLPEEFKEGSYDLNLKSAFDDGDIYTTYTSSRGESAIPMFMDLEKVDSSQEDGGEAFAKEIYSELLGTSNFTIRRKTIEQGGREVEVFVPYGKSDEAYTVRLDGTDEEVLDLIDNSVYGFKKAFKEQMRLAAQKKQEGVGENKNKPRKKPTGIKWK